MKKLQKISIFLIAALFVAGLLFACSSCSSSNSGSDSKNNSGNSSDDKADDKAVEDNTVTLKVDTQGAIGEEEVTAKIGMSSLEGKYKETVATYTVEKGKTVHLKAHPGDGREVVWPEVDGLTQATKAHENKRKIEMNKDESFTVIFRDKAE